MVSPQKRTATVGRLRSGAKAKGDSPEEWVSGGSFLFAESPVIPKREGNNRRVSNAGRIVKNKQVPNRRQSVIMKRLEMDLVTSSISPRRTRRQSMAVFSTSERRSMLSTSPVKAAAKNKPMLPPKKPAPTKSQESNIKRTEVKIETTLSLSPMKFYSSPPKQKAMPIPPRRSTEGGKRKFDTGDSSNKVEPSTKKNKGEASILKSPRSLRRGRSGRISVSAKSSPAASKKTSSAPTSPSAVQRNSSKSAIPLRTVTAKPPNASKAGSKRVTPVKNVKSPAPLKKIKTPSPQKKAKSLSAEEKVGPRITRNTSQTKTVKKLTSPKAVMPAKKQEVQSPKGKSPAAKPLTEERVSRSKSSFEKKSKTPVNKNEVSPKKKSTPTKISTPTQKAASPSQNIKTPPAKIKTQMSPIPSVTPSSVRVKRLTRSAKSSKKVSLVAKSPQSVASSFRKTPGSKKTTFKVADLGSSPLLSAKSQLVLIRSCSPLRSVQKNLRMKSKPYTPKPDSPPSNILRKSMKNKVSQQMKAVTRVEVHQLMNGEISKPVKITASSGTTSSSSFLQSKVSTPIVITPRKPINSSMLNGGDSEIRVLATTPVSASNLPPTPTSSRKLSESMLVSRHVTSQSTTKKSCQRVLTPAAPRSSTPIEADNSVLESLNLGTVMKKLDKETNFTDDSINTDTSDMEASLTDFKENKSLATDKKGKWSCLLM